MGKAIMDLNIPPECLVTAIIRGGQIVLPRGPTILEEGDEILALTDGSGSQLLEDLLSAEG